jgi:hypothetical protein
VKRLVLYTLWLAVASCAVAQDCKPKTDFGGWLFCKIEQRSRMVANINNGTRQQETPSTASNSTSLVDQTSASDLVNLALNLAKLTTSTSGSNDQNSVTVTTSAYALYAAANHHDLLDPSFYARNRDWRKAFFTVGRDSPDTTRATSTSTGGQTSGNAIDRHAQGSGTIAGVKYVLWDRRDVTSPSNDGVFKNVGSKLGAAAKAENEISVEVKQKFGEDFLNPFNPKILLVFSRQPHDSKRSRG